MPLLFEKGANEILSPNRLTLPSDEESRIVIDNKSESTSITSKSKLNELSSWVSTNITLAIGASLTGIIVKYIIPGSDDQTPSEAIYDKLSVPK